MISIDPPERGQGRPKSTVGLDIVDQAERLGGQGGPEISRDVGWRGPVRGPPFSLFVEVKVIGREPPRTGHRLERMPGGASIVEQLLAILDLPGVEIFRRE
jgi:hypothetical protein